MFLLKCTFPTQYFIQYKRANAIFNFMVFLLFKILCYLQKNNPYDLACTIFGSYKRLFKNHSMKLELLLKSKLGLIKSNLRYSPSVWHSRVTACIRWFYCVTTIHDFSFKCLTSKRLYYNFGKMKPCS